MRIVTYRLRKAADPGVVYGEDVPERTAAFARARELADFYGHAVEVCQVMAGHIIVGVESLVDPGPTAPAD